MERLIVPDLAPIAVPKDARQFSKRSLREVKEGHRWHKTLVTWNRREGCQGFQRPKGSSRPGLTKFEHHLHLQQIWPT